MFGWERATYGGTKKEEKEESEEILYNINVRLLLNCIMLMPVQKKSDYNVLIVGLMVPLSMSGIPFPTEKK